MAIAIKQIMLITRNVQFAIDVKRALEALGEYSVTTVADIRNAIEQLRETSQHLVLLDTSDLTVSPSIMIELIRSRQSEIAIVLAPDLDSVHELARRYRIQGVVDIPVMARSLIPILEGSLRSAYGSLPPAKDDAPAELSEDTVTIESLVGELFGDEPGLNYTRRRLQASLELLNPRPEQAAAKEALEFLVEPDDEGDTVRFRYIKTSDGGASTEVATDDVSVDETTVASGSRSETVKDLVENLTAEASGESRQLAAPAARLDDGDAEIIDDSAEFARMLDTVLDESTALENLTLESLFDTTRELPGALGTGAVPAWLRETEKFIKEPGFLSESLPAIESVEDFDATTVPAAVEEPGAVTAQALEVNEADTEANAQTDAQPAGLSDFPSWAPLSSRDSDPLLAQLAVTMTRVMSDLTADATVLARDNRIVAFSGDMALSDFRALRKMIADDWSADGGQSRIRFVKLPSAEAEYMLCSRGTVGDHCLTLIFAGNKHLRDIRLQGDRIMRALADVPDNGARSDGDDSADSEAAASDTRQPFAFVWIVADPALVLRKELAEQLVFWLEVQLNGLNWTVHRLDVHQDFIYLYADVPARASPEYLARTVMERSRKIACSEDKGLPTDLWADAYLVLQPGRDLGERELRHFLQFARG
ncbi:MAG: hypothetical protein OXG78_09595 [Chloroflexi bacterium]|nr:hypothetical protein [Chloroflexota bacterium]